MPRVTPAAPLEIFSFPPQEGDLAPFEVGSGRQGVLLIHGFCGTPPEMRGLGDYLAARGYLARGVLLPGHGTTPEDLDTCRWQDWYDACDRELRELDARCDSIFVAGQSMGGTLSLLLAARRPKLRAVATTAALIDLGPRTHVSILLGQHIRRWHYPDRNRVDLWDPEGVKLLRSYNKRSLRAHVELLRLMRATRHELSKIKQPALIVHGMRDGLVPPRNAERIAELIGANATYRTFERSGHAMSVDVDHPEIFALIAQHFAAAAAEPLAEVSQAKA